MSGRPSNAHNRGVTAPKGFRAGGIAAGIKPSGRRDLALIVSDTPATAAAVYTTNQVKAAPVLYCQRYVTSGQAHAIIVNSGNANACTGAVGMIHARAMAAGVARRIGCDEDEVFVCSTGRIGVRLPSVKIQAGIKQLLGILSPSGGQFAAEAIMTSDTVTKEACARFRVGQRTYTVGGMAKGAGMIHPNMATMLGLITTDAPVAHPSLQKALSTAVNQSFNRISVDGDMSTNDTVILLANGMAGGAKLTGRGLERFQSALNKVCLQLALMIVADGEGISRVVTVRINGALSDAEAELAARAVCNSVLVKASWCGGDPNWGRLMDAVGYSGAKLHSESIDISYDRVAVVRKGVAARTSMSKLSKVVAQPKFTVEIDLHLGRGSCTMYSTDLTEKYIDFNKGE